MRQAADVPVTVNSSRSRGCPCRSPSASRCLRKWRDSCRTSPSPRSDTPVADKVTLPEKPFDGVMAMVLVPALPP